MHRRYLPALDRRCQRRPMSLVQTRRLTRRLAVDQSIRAIRVELQHPVPDDLSRHPTNFRRLGTRSPVIDCCERQQSAHLVGVLALARRYTDTRRVIVRAHWDWHGETPRSPALNQTRPASGKPRESGSVRLGMSEIPVMVARGWSEAQKRAYVIADNKLTLNAGWDPELLR